MILHLFGGWFLWDTSDTFGDLVVVRHGKVVETNRSFVWTYDGTETFVDHDTDPYEILDFDDKGQNASRVIIIAVKDTLFGIDRLQKMYDLYHECDFHTQTRCLYTITRKAIAASSATDDTTRKQLVEEQFARFGWHVMDYRTLRLPKLPN